MSLRQALLQLCVHRPLHTANMADTEWQRVKDEVLAEVRVDIEQLQRDVAAIQSQLAAAPAAVGTAVQRQAGEIVVDVFVREQKKPWDGFVNALQLELDKIGDVARITVQQTTEVKGTRPLWVVLGGVIGSRMENWVTEEVTAELEALATARGKGAQRCANTQTYTNPCAISQITYRLSFAGEEAMWWDRRAMPSSCQMHSKWLHI